MSSKFIDNFLSYHTDAQVNKGNNITHLPKINIMKKRLEETQTQRTGCSKAEPKIFAQPQTPFPGRGTAKI